MSIRKLFLVTPILVLAAACGCLGGIGCGSSSHDHSQPRSGGQESRPDRAVAYTCPMHPEVVAQGSGECPECGMALVETK